MFERLTNMLESTAPDTAITCSDLINSLQATAATITADSLQRRVDWFQLEQALATWGA